MRQWQTIRNLLIASAVCLCVLPIAFYFDLVIATNVSHATLPGEFRTLFSCAEAYSHYYGVFLILLTIYISSPRLQEKVKATALLILFSGAAVFLAKNTLVRLRPRGGAAADFSSVWDTFAGINPLLTRLETAFVGNSSYQSYPSGHTATAVTLAIGLSVMFPRAKYLFGLFAALAAAQRVGFQAHYLSDVVAGAIFGFLSSAILLSTPFFRNRLLIENLPDTFPVIDEFPEPYRELQDDAEPAHRRRAA